MLDPDLIVHSGEPLNAEPRLDRLRRSFVTPVGSFYIRCHGDLPALDGQHHAVSVSGRVGKPMTFTVDELKQRFTPSSVLAVMQCAGNRRADLQPVRPTSGDPWAPGAIGNAAWTGVPLAAVLREAGAETGAELHVAFEAADVASNEGAPDAPFGVSIPMGKALAEDTLLAWAMNGKALTREHGAPLRAVVPGFAGVRSAKWLRAITVQDRPSGAFQQARDYLMFPPDMRPDREDLSRGVVINAMPLTSAICEPPSGAALPVGRAEVRGYAVATDRAVVRVDVSSNGGEDWVQATLEDHGGSRWAWTFWHAALDLPAGGHELVVRAWDEAGQTQPERARDMWNFKGYLGTAWHRVTVTAA